MNQSSNSVKHEPSSPVLSPVRPRRTVAAATAYATPVSVARPAPVRVKEEFVEGSSATPLQSRSAHCIPSDALSGPAPSVPVSTAPSFATPIDKSHRKGDMAPPAGDYSAYKGRGRYGRARPVDPGADADMTINAAYEINPEQNGGQNFAFDEVVRGRAERMRLPAGDCMECRAVSVSHPIHTTEADTDGSTTRASESCPSASSVLGGARPAPTPPTLPAGSARTTRTGPCLRPTSRRSSSTKRVCRGIARAGRAARRRPGSGTSACRTRRSRPRLTSALRRCGTRSAARSRQRRSAKAGGGVSGDRSFGVWHKPSLAATYTSLFCAIRLFVCVGRPGVTDRPSCDRGDELATDKASYKPKRAVMGRQPRPEVH
jgi:hypothetical protein